MRPRGFTLFEILVTMTLVALVIALVGSTLVGTATSATLAKLHAQQEGELLKVVSTMRRQIITIAASSATQTPVVGEIGRDPHSDWLDMISSSPIYKRGVAHVEWRIIRKPGEDPYLGYREAPYVGGENLHDNPFIPFSRLITGMQVKYWSNPQYVDGWKRNEVPERVMVILYYINGEQEGSFMFEASPGIGGTTGAPITTSVPSPSASSSASPNAAPSTSPSTSPNAGASTSPGGGSPNNSAGANSGGSPGGSTINTGPGR